MKKTWKEKETRKENENKERTKNGQLKQKKNKGKINKETIAKIRQWNEMEWENKGKKNNNKSKEVITHETLQEIININRKYNFPTNQSIDGTFVLSGPNDKVSLISL